MLLRKNFLFLTSESGVRWRVDRRGVWSVWEGWAGYLVRFEHLLFALSGPAGEAEGFSSFSRCFGLKVKGENSSLVYGGWSLSGRHQKRPSAGTQEVKHTSLNKKKNTGKFISLSCFNTDTFGENTSRPLISLTLGS